MEDWELPLATRNFTQKANAQRSTDFSSNMPAHNNTHERYRYSEQCWEQPNCDDDGPDNPSWPPTPTPRLDMFIAQTAPPDTPIAEQRANDKQDGGQAPEIEKRNSKRRKRSTFSDHTESDDKEQRRIQHIVKNLEIFEKQQKMYGRQQLKAIRDGVA